MLWNVIIVGFKIIFVAILGLSSGLLVMWLGDGSKFDREGRYNLPMLAAFVTCFVMLLIRDLFLGGLFPLGKPQMEEKMENIAWPILFGALLVLTDFLFFGSKK